MTLRGAADRRTLALAVANPGSLEHDLGNLDAARRGYVEAQEIERELGMRSDEGIAQMNLGHLALEAFEIDEARAFYDRAIEIQREVGSRRWQAIALGYLGLCHEIAGRRDEARDVYVEAIARHDEDGDAIFGGLTRCWLARLQAARGSLEEARATLRVGREGIVRGGATLFEHVATICEAAIEGRGAEAAIDAAANARSSEVRIAVRMLRASANTASVSVSTSGRRATMPDGTEIDLTTRAPLRRLLLALVDHPSPISITTGNTIGTSSARRATRVRSSSARTTSTRRAPAPTASRRVPTRTAPPPTATTRVEGGARLGLGEPGYTRSVGDLALEGAKITVKEPSKVFNRATYYAAKPDPAGPELKARLKTFTGPRKTYCK